ncbi:SMP-30/gluconolactonase/LRE family protein [Aquimarina sp. 2201CG14-23]|uniref:SMP-30/gluconolactonase/LRE family protein n=1 Tax=Aquimarina mycalae TaxID=3040073 RepID=UPI0024780E01|nr:SMP-30/gluconolactonase/LRE family protein [Aquimarina sp. 2201CG14-23]MDH7444528.1 SMP-30/gluconolactonase/LRE family protein [Aquimarina sp. 2201CG14-23]
MYASKYFILFLILMSCSKRITSKDFTKEGEFTDGIEGPATDTEGNIYVVNYKKQGTIGKVTKSGSTSLFLELPNGSIANGIRFMQEDEMYVADYTNHNILKINTKNKEIKVVANQPLANQPNDLAISPNGTIYASDPNWQEQNGNLWRVTEEKGFELLESDMGTTNGIEVSPDGKHLYVNESIQRKIWVYDITNNNDITNKRLFAKFEDFGMDGMRCTRSGHLFVCRYDKGTVVAFTPEGKLVKEVFLKGKKPTNITFSNDSKIAYVTLEDRGCLEMFRTTIF